MIAHKIQRYSKSSSFYAETKKSFFEENDLLLKKALEQNRLYASQPKRALCKLCKAKLPDATDFSSHGVSYVFCEKCTHLNGHFEETESFFEKLYASDDNSQFSFLYIDSNYQNRTDVIYTPKLDFLLNAIPSKIHSILDVGCGSGYFVYAAISNGVHASGIDVSKTMVNYGNFQISSRLNGISPLEHANSNSLSS